jgi:hypothetical protein
MLSKAMCVDLGAAVEDQAADVIKGVTFGGGLAAHDKLYSTFEATNMASRVAMLDSLVEIVRTKPITAHNIEFLELWRQCKEKHITLDMPISVLYLHSLGVEYGDFKALIILSSSGNSTDDMDLSALQRNAVECAQQKLKLSPGDEQSGDYAMCLSENYEESTKVFNMVCHHCGRAGHLKRD